MWYDYYTDKAITFEICKNIKNSILSNYEKSDYFYLFTGKTGSLLYLMNYNKHYSHEKDITHFIQRELLNLLNLLETEEPNYTLGYGFTGIGWLINYYINNHMDQNNIFDPEILDDFDDFVLQGINHCAVSKDYDLFEGYIGLGLYLLERLPEKDALNGIQRIINIIYDNASFHRRWSLLA